MTRDELVRDITPERIARVEEILTAAKANIAGWEVDFGKEEMTKGKTWMNLSWSGDAQWAIDEAEEMGIKLEYIVPEEGSNVWFDGWCIPKYAVNTKAATWWINYLCLPENAIKNMDFIGYVSVISTPEIRAWVDEIQQWPEPLDLSYFFGTEALAVHANPVLYPDKAIIDRCALMHDAGDMNKDLLAMWNRVKGDNLSPVMLGIIIVVVLAIVLFAVMHMINQRKQQNLQRKRKSKR